MRDVLNWWKDRTSQLLVLVTFAMLLAWQNLELRRADRYFRKVVAEVRESIRQQETARHVEFARMLNTIETRLTQIGEAIATAHGKADQPAAEPARKLGRM